MPTLEVSGKCTAELTFSVLVMNQVCLYRTWGLQQCSEFIAKGSLKDPYFLYVFQIYLNHKPFFAKNSLESNPSGK